MKNNVFYCSALLLVAVAAPSYAMGTALMRLRAVGQPITQGAGALLRKTVRWAGSVAGDGIEAAVHPTMETMQTTVQELKQESVEWRTQAAQFGQEVTALRTTIDNQAGAINTNLTQFEQLGQQYRQEIAALRTVVDNQAGAINNNLAQMVQLGNNAQQTLLDTRHMTERLVLRTLGTIVCMEALYLAWREWVAYRERKHLEWQLKNIKQLERLAQLQQTKAIG
ncbi:hypothetical protein M1466_03520 [Candidatus Dependentiae bacterium]|nr:hypothetical protein [Candidatus Dependentiae bacterium]